jgi:hypothetical protein
MSTTLAHELEVALRARDDKAVLAAKSPGGADDHVACIDGALGNGSVAQFRQRWASVVPSRGAYMFGTFAHFCNRAALRRSRISSPISIL